MSTFLARVTSRKFLMSLGTILTVIFGSDLQGPQLAIVGFVAAAYTLSEALTDRPRTDLVVQGLDAGLSLGQHATQIEGAFSAEELTKLRALLAALATPGPALPSQPARGGEAEQ